MRRRVFFVMWLVFNLLATGMEIRALVDLRVWWSLVLLISVVFSFGIQTGMLYKDMRLRKIMSQT